MNRKIMVIDGNSIINRAFYGVPLLTNSEGLFTNAVYGFLNIMFKLIDEENPDYLAVSFDVSAPTFRHKMYQEYKANRKSMPEELRPQIPLLKEVLEAMNIPKYELEGYEGDDILGTIANEAVKAGITPVIVSGDRDMLQLATDVVKIRIPKTKAGKTEIEDYYANDVKEKYGVTPKEFIDVKALMGDASDNVPGIASIGEKTAIKIIQEYHCIESAIENAEQVKPKKASENLREFKSDAFLSKELVTIKTDVPINLDFEKTVMGDIMTKQAYEIFKRLGFKSFLEKFKKKDEIVQLMIGEDSKIIGEDEAVKPTKKAEISNDFFYERIDDLKSVKEFTETILKQKEVSYVIFNDVDELYGISFSYQDNKAMFIEVGKNFSKSDLLKQLKPFFESAQNEKIAHNQKENISFLRKNNIELKGVVFDTFIAAYILNPTRDTYHYDDLAGDFLSEVYISEEELLGKGKSKKTLMSLQERERTVFTGRYADIVRRAMYKIQQKLMDNDQKKLYYSIEHPLIEVLASMEKYGFKIDENALIEYGEVLSRKIASLTAEIYFLAGEEFNINSPKQLGEILFEKLGLMSAKKNKTGYSTAADILEKLAPEHPIVSHVLEYRTYSKLKSTYVDGLLAVMNKEDSKIYSTFNQTITATGRISSTEPNLQNIPIRLELGRELRKVFIPTDESFVLLDADYSQIELRVLAHLSGDETLIKAFCENQDIHRLTASQVFKVPFEQVTSLQRSNAKAVNFGIIYGMGAFSLSQDLKISRKEAERYIEGYFEKYPKVKLYLDGLVEFAHKNGYAETFFNRRRIIPEINSRNYVQRSFGERVAMNMPIQGSAADIIKIAMVRVQKRLEEEKLTSRLILQVHDELLIEAKKDELEVVKVILKNEMENAVQFDVPMEVDMKVGNTWFETK